MPDKKRPSERHIISLQELERFHKDCNFNDRMNELEAVFEYLESEDIKVFAILSDTHMATRFSNGIDGCVLVKALVKFFEEHPEVYKAILVETFHGMLHPKGGRADDN